MTNTDYSEDTLVEQPAIALFSELGYDRVNCFCEKVGGSDSTLAESLTLDELRVALGIERTTGI